MVDEILPKEFSAEMDKDILKSLLVDGIPNWLNCFSDTWDVSYKPQDPKTFLLGMVVGYQEASWNKEYLRQYGKGNNYDDPNAERIAFAIHRKVAQYKPSFEEIIQKHLDSKK